MLGSYLCKTRVLPCGITELMERESEQDRRASQMKLQTQMLDPQGKVVRRKRVDLQTRLSSYEKADQVQKLKTQLEQRHGTEFNTCQYRLWAEMIFAGIHDSMEKPPQVPMFGAQRKRASPRGGSPESCLSNTLTGVAVAIRDVLSPQPTQSNRMTISSPSKAVDLRSKYLQQLEDVMSLRDMGGLTDEEYQERSTIVRQMRKLQRDD